MTTQAIAALITFMGIAAMVGVFLFVLSNSRPETPYEEVQPRAYAIRKLFFLLLLAGFFVVPALTLRDLPYPIAATGAPATPSLPTSMRHPSYP